MEEELNDDLEERLYALIHHVDESQGSAEPSHDASPHVVEAPRSTVRRYWRTSYNHPYQKTNTPKEATPPNKTPTAANKTTPAPQTNETRPKEENDAPESPPSDLISILKNTVPQNYVKTVEILDIDVQPNVVELESSDEDEVIEVQLPPKPTITIESSDDDELICKPAKSVKDNAKRNASKENKSPNKSNRDVSASPVPSVMSSMSDEFIRGDCLALNISSAQPDNESFDFSLHGSDLLGDGTPSKKKKKKKSKDRLTSTPIAAEVTLAPKQLDNIFATPKSKAKNKKQKSKSYVVSEKSIPNADIYDSDSNQSVIDINKHPDVYIVTEKSFPNPDVYESDSSMVESIKGNTAVATQLSKRIEVDSSDSNTSLEIAPITNLQSLVSLASQNLANNTLVDLTDDTLEQTNIEENIIIGNVSGFKESEDYGDESLVNPASGDSQELGKFCSTKVPQILYEDLDFDNLKGKDKVCRRRRYSLTTLRAEMEKFYNESWGGENFNHQEILKHMSRDKSLWVIDPKDRMPNPPKRRVTCNLCNRTGHRDDTCRLKPPVCYMCGNTGHYEPRCPRKICVNCGSPNFVYSTMCRNCASWGRQSCAECSQPGHPASHCPDVWRRYHNTIDENMPLEKTPGPKPQHQLFCSGCARRGHLVHACRAFVPFCPLPIPSPAVARYWRLYPPTTPKHKPQDDTVSSMTPRTDRNKRLSKSPTAHETHVNKKRMTSEGDSNKSQPAPRKISLSKEPEEVTNVSKQVEVSANPVEETTLTKVVEKALDYIPISSNNHDKRGQVIQDNEVSDTSEVLTSARIYVTTDVADRLLTPEGQDWLKSCTEKLEVDVQRSDVPSFLTIKGTVGGQEAFQSELREWTKGENDREPATNSDTPRDENSDDKVAFLMPKKKNDVLRTLGNAFDSLKHDIGDPRKMYKELMYLQNNHETLLHQKVISPAKVKNNRNHINMMTKKLNMILLGQAGLGEGSKHMSELYTLQEKLINFRQQKVPMPLREAISRHYRLIFTAAPRDDYVELVRMFNKDKRKATFKQNKKNNLLKLKSKNRKRNFNKTPQQDMQPFPSSEKPINVEYTENNVVPVMPTPPRRKALMNKGLMNKLMFYKRRLLNASAKDKARNYHRLTLVNRLQSHIARLSEKEGANKSAKKKMKKTQEQARVFLTDI